jgi:hypothetical protein
LIGNGTIAQLAERFGDGAAHIEAGFEFENPGDADRAPGLIRAIDGVVDVRSGPGPDDPWMVTVRPPSAGGAVRQAILSVAASEGLHLVSMRPIVPSLEEIYRLAVARSTGETTGAVH